MRLRDSKCVHLRCMNCGEIGHTHSTKGLLALARTHVVEFDCQLEDVYVQKCFHWEAIE